jgi:hypothetical protein
MRRATGVVVKYNHLDTVVWDKYSYDNAGRLAGAESCRSGIGKELRGVKQICRANRTVMVNR